MQSIISFISDFGLEDTWVGVCHAVINRACPQAHVVDLGHQIPPFDIRKGAATAAAGVYQLPEAIHLVVVDPGVGGGRRDICIVTKSGTRLVGPDNGVLLPAAWRAGGVERAYAIDPAKIDFRGPLATFHARDILAPAAAALACGVDPSALGQEIDSDSLTKAPFERCTSDGEFLLGEVLEADRFGSLRFNISADDMEQFGLSAETLEISLGHNALTVPFRTTFSDVDEGDPVALVDSSGWLTLALNTGDAADRYGVEPGTNVRVRAI
ncbi:MAG TPA: SAM-dependent chlorinase/fluorinase [Coriobacteriia bacterium]|nr:SAM-dependent chlorinase/fluorinase [Coriobacteriia bacterium]